MAIVPAPTQGQLYTNVGFADIDQDGHTDVLACDGLRGRVSWFRNDGQSDWDQKSWTRNDLNPDQLIPSASHITPMDLDSDGDQDLLVTALGRIQPTNDEVGRLYWFENDSGTYSMKEILGGIRRGDRCARR